MNWQAQSNVRINSGMVKRMDKWTDEQKDREMGEWKAEGRTEELTNEQTNDEGTNEQTNDEGTNKQTNKQMEWQTNEQIDKQISEFLQLLLEPTNDLIKIWRKLHHTVNY